MSFHSLYRLEARGLLRCPIVGVASSRPVQKLRDRARFSIEGCGEQVDEAVFARLADRLSYVQGDFTDSATFTHVAEALDGAQTPVLYLEVPPLLFATMIKRLSEAGLTANARVIVEEPFGHELESALALAADIHQSIEESQLYRVDHCRFAADPQTSVIDSNCKASELDNLYVVDTSRLVPASPLPA